MRTLRPCDHPTPVEFLLERRERCLIIRIIFGEGRQHADAPHPFAGCCARAASGHATAVPPAAAMKSRRLMPAMGTFSARIPDRPHVGAVGEALGWNVRPE